MLDYEQTFRDSYNRVLNRRTSEEQEFFDLFYETFTASSPLVAEKFRGVDMEGQKVMLKQSLIHLLNLSSTKKIPDSLVEIARKHDAFHADIPARLYELWLECLIDTVRRMDPKFNPDIELAWRMICAQGVAYMTFKYRESLKAAGRRED